jgi:acyl-CoA thioesterase FadM
MNDFASAGRIVRPADGRLVLDSRGVMVMYDYARNTSIAVPDDVRQRIEAHAGREFPRPA